MSIRFQFWGKGNLNDGPPSSWLAEQSGLRLRAITLLKTCSIGFRSGEYFGRKSSLAPAERMSVRTALLLWLPRLSRMTMSPWRSVGRRTFST